MTLDTLENLCAEFEGANLGDTEDIDRLRRELLEEIERQAADVDPEAIHYAMGATYPREIVDATEWLVEECLDWIEG